METVAVEDTYKVFKSILGEENLMRIQEEYAIPMSVRLELLGPSMKMTMGSTIRAALHEDLLKIGLRFLLPTIIVELLRWYQVCPTQLVPSA